MKIQINNHWLTTTPIAHRGLHSCSKTIPENSMTSFQKAIENKYAIELDVQLSKDNEIVVFHDYDLLRVCNSDNKVVDLSLKELQKLTLFNTKEKIPTFQEVLDLIDNQVPLLIEIKNESSSNLLEEKLNIVLQSYKGRFAVQSFNPKSLSWFYKNNNKILRGQLSSKFSDIKMNPIIKYLLSNLYLNFLSHPDFIAYNIDDLPKKKIQKIRKNMPILGWTINNKSKLTKTETNCDNIIFECIKL